MEETTTKKTITKTYRNMRANIDEKIIPSEPLLKTNSTRDKSPIH